MPAHQPGTCCCSNDCCDCDDTPEEFIVDIGSGGWTDRGRCTDCPGVAGEFTLHKFHRGAGAADPYCYWDYHDYNFCDDDDPDVGDFSSGLGPCADPYALIIQLRIIPDSGCIYELTIELHCGTSMVQAKHWVEVVTHSGTERCEHDTNGDPFCNNGKGVSFWVSFNQQAEDAFDDCDAEMDFPMTSEGHGGGETAACDGTLPATITVRRA